MVWNVILICIATKKIALVVNMVFISMLDNTIKFYVGLGLSMNVSCIRNINVCIYCAAGPW